MIEKPYQRGQHVTNIQVVQPVESAGDPLTYAQRELPQLLPHLVPATPPPVGAQREFAQPFSEHAQEVTRRAEWRQLRALRRTTRRAEVVSWVSLGVGVVTLLIVAYWSWRVVELAEAIHRALTS